MKIALWSAWFFKFAYFTHHSHVKANQTALFLECVVHPVFIFCLFFCKWGQKVWSARFWWVINKLEKPGGPLAIFMPYLADLLPFMVIFERMLWRQSHPPAYHHPVVCILDIITNKFTFLIEIEIWNKKSKNYFLAAYNVLPVG